MKTDLLMMQDTQAAVIPGTGAACCSAKHIRCSLNCQRIFTTSIFIRVCSCSFHFLFVYYCENIKKTETFFFLLRRTRKLTSLLSLQEMLTIFLFLFHRDSAMAKNWKHSLFLSKSGDFKQYKLLAIDEYF